MQNALNFLPRLQMREIARQAVRLWMTHALTSTATVNGVQYVPQIDFELNAVFIFFDSPQGERKVSVHTIQKGW